MSDSSASMPPDVIFLSYEEPNAEEHWARVLKFAPHAKRVHRVTGIYNAWRAAAGLATTPHFFMVDGDSWILDGFRFEVPKAERKSDVFMWRARNAVNGLELFNGCLKLVNRAAVLSMEKDALDFVVSMKGDLTIVEKLATETRFNASPFLTWRCAFRECAKFAAQMVDNWNIPNIVRVWETVGADKPFGRWCMLGARMGSEFGRTHQHTETMRLIHDMDHMKAEFAKIAQRIEQGELSLPA